MCKLLTCFMIQVRMTVERSPRGLPEDQKIILNFDSASKRHVISPILVLLRLSANVKASLMSQFKNCQISLDNKILNSEDHLPFCDNYKKYLLIWFISLSFSFYPSAFSLDYLIFLNSASGSFMSLNYIGVEQGVALRSLRLMLLISCFIAYRGILLEFDIKNFLICSTKPFDKPSLLQYFYAAYKGFAPSLNGMVFGTPD